MVFYVHAHDHAHDQSQAFTSRDNSWRMLLQCLLHVRYCPKHVIKVHSFSSGNNLQLYFLLFTDKKNEPMEVK